MRRGNSSFKKFPQNQSKIDTRAVIVAFYSSLVLEEEEEEEGFVGVLQKRFFRR
jgi:hypothetical protein